MAKVLFGMMAVDMRNKLGGQVFSKNRGGAYIRTKVTPTNPQTVAQQGARYNLTEFAQTWRTLTAAQRASWEAAVSNYQKTDIFGQLKSPSGINLYCKLNINLAEIGVAPITTPPTPGSLSEVTGVTLTASHTANVFTIAWTSGAVPAGENWIIRATKGLSAGRNFFKGFYRVIDTLPPAATSPELESAAYVAKFGNIVAGQKYAVEIIQVNNVTGQKGQPITAFAIAT